MPPSTPPHPLNMNTEHFRRKLLLDHWIPPAKSLPDLRPFHSLSTHGISSERQILCRAFLPFCCVGGRWGGWFRRPPSSRCRRVADRLRKNSGFCREDGPPWISLFHTMQWAAILRRNLRLLGLIPSQHSWRLGGGGLFQPVRAFLPFLRYSD